jgi:dTDP-L-rhamnose 4-epimerase
MEWNAEMAERILITGGAGFIGSHLAHELLTRGRTVRVLDNLTPQVHTEATPQPILGREAELQVGDVRDAAAVGRALAGVDAVVHLAARVGVGQSMYEIAGYTETNAGGTAVLLQALLQRPVGTLVVASSMSVYGEGRYLKSDGTVVDTCERTRDQLGRDDWELRDASGEPLVPVPTPEAKQPAISSVYSLTKFYQERACLLFGTAYDVPTVALRFFNVYGPGQALSNPYTGVLANFASRLLNDRPPILFEDGLQRRDFVHVRDVTRACALALESPKASGQAINVGSGASVSIADLAVSLAALLGKPIEPVVTADYRVGDVRHCFADVSRAAELLGYTPAVPLAEGLRELAAWLTGRSAEDLAERAGRELASRGLTI